MSVFLEEDGLLIAGDAIVTTQQESFFSVIFQQEKLSGPPKYFTYDWEAARQSVKQLADLHPRIIATGHGRPLRYKRLTEDLKYLADHFSEVAVPKTGRYVNHPAIVDENGVKYIPPLQ